MLNQVSHPYQWVRPTGCPRETISAGGRNIACTYAAYSLGSMLACTVKRPLSTRASMFNV